MDKVIDANGLYTLYDEHGNAQKFHGVDKNEAILTGMWFEEPPKKKKGKKSKKSKK
jgi:hypothetical protein